MRVPVSKAGNLIFNGRTIAGAWTGNGAGSKRRQMQRVTNNLVAKLRCPGNGAGNLAGQDSRC